MLSLLCLLLVTSVICVNAQTVVATVPVGLNPQWVALNPVTNKIYVANEGDNTVTVIDGVTFNTTAVSVFSPSIAVVNPLTNKIYVGGATTYPTISVIDGATLATSVVLSGVYLGQGPKSMAVNPVTDKIYAVTSNCDLVVIDGATQSTTTVSNDGCGFGGGSVAINTLTNKIYVTQETGTAVVVVDGASNNIVANVVLGAGYDAIEVNERTNKIYVASFRDNFVAVINGSSDSLLATLPVETCYYGTGLGVNQLTDSIFVAGYQGIVTKVGGAATNMAAGTAHIGNSAPYDLKLDTQSNTVFVGSSSGYTVSFVNGATLFANTLQVGNSVGNMAIDQTRKRLYVATGIGTAGNVLVFDGNGSLSVSAIGSGTVSSADGHINCGANCTQPYYWGASVVYLTALPNPGSTLAGWNGCDTSYGNICMVQVKGNQSVRAMFSPTQVTFNSFTFQPSTVRLGSSTIATLTLGAPAPSGGVTVALSSSKPISVHVPETVYIPGGQAFTKFMIRTSRVRSSRSTVAISATAGTALVTGHLVVTP
ncbi:MAG: YncE family protein [Candidatus Korobacteraceae bacterium]